MTTCNREIYATFCSLSSSRLSELESLLEQLEEDSKTKLQMANARLHDTASEANQLKLENEHIKVRSFGHCFCIYDGK